MENFPQPNATINLATFNIRNPCDKAPNNWEARIPRIQAIIDKYQFDIVGLQEVTQKQLDELLKDDRWDAIGVAREDGHHGGEYSCIFYRKDRFKLICTSTFWLSETPYMPGSRSWETCCTRICTWGKFQDLLSGKIFLYFNTHLDHRSHPAQINGIKVILDAIKTFPTDIPKFLTGDFNVYPDSDVVAATSAVLLNAAAIAKNGYDCPPYTYHAYGTWQPPEPGKRCEIDYIFVSQGVSVDNVKALTDTFDNGLYPSDHFPLRAVVSLP